MHYLEALLALLRSLGIPGLFLLSLVDSAGLITASGPDVLIAFLVSSEPSPERAVRVALTAVAGSLLGSLVLYALGRRGGVALERLRGDRGNRIRTRVERFGAWAVAFAVLAPPPIPMKLFIVAAGLFRMPLRGFALAVAAGRLLRYLLVAFVAARYGELAGAVLREHGLAAVLLLAAAVAAWWLACRRWSDRRDDGRATLPPPEAPPIF